MLNNSKLQAFLAIVPPILLLITILGYFFFLFSFVSEAEAIERNGGEVVPTQIFAGIGIFIFLILICSLISLFSLIYFIIHAAKNPNLNEGNMRIIWILVLVFVSGLGSLVYWLVEIRSKNPKPVIP